MMTQEPFKILPSEIIIYILSKLPPRTILICKCVCKSWHHLVDSQEFVKLHLSTSVPGLVTLKVGGRSGSINFFEIEDGHDVEHHDLHYNLATSFNFPHAQWLCGSVDGLLWLHEHTTTREADAICICNPITRDYIRIHTPLEFPSTKHQWTIYGFGSCRMSSQHKLVRILLDNICDKDSGYERIQSRSIAECHVYTLGSGCGWRRPAPCALNCVTPTARQNGASLNGNLHWLGCDLNRCLWISCFDLETESFRTFTAAPPLHSASEPDMVELFAWGESLCLSDNTNEHDFVVWVMEEYGIVKSWTKKFVFNLKIHSEYFAGNRLLKVFKSGDVLMEINFKLFYFSSKTKNLQQVDMFKGGYSAHFLHLENIKGVIHTPSLRSLKSFGMENVYWVVWLLAYFTGAMLRGSDQPLGSFTNHCLPLHIGELHLWIEFPRTPYPNRRAIRHKFNLEIDGDLGPSTIDQTASAGPTCIVASSSVFGAPNPAHVISFLRKSVEDAQRTN